VRQNNINQGRISGTYYLLGDEVEVILTLTLDASSQQIAIDRFRIPVAEIERLGLAILPPNNKSQEEALQREQLLAQPVVQQPVVTATPAASAVQPAPPTQAPAGTAVQTPTAPLRVTPQPAPVPPKAGFALNVWADHDSRVYYDGEQMTIRLWADRDCYFIVYHIDVDNVRQVIFPNQYDRGSNLLKADVVKTIPSEGSRFDLCAPFGEERILVFASDKPFTIPNAERVTAPLSSELLATSRGMVVNKDTLEAEAMFSYTILPKR
jgi:hypothetical protein